MAAMEVIVVARWLITTWAEGFVVEANDEQHALVEAQSRIMEDGYLLCPVELEEGEDE